MGNENLNTEKTDNSRLGAVIGTCFCGKPAIVYAFDTYFCHHHDDELAKSFEARMKMPDNDFDGGGISEQLVCDKCKQPIEHDGEGEWCEKCQTYTYD